MGEISGGYTKSAVANVGGVKSFVVINVENINFTSTNEVVQSISKTAQGYRISLDINSGFANSTGTGDRANNSIKYVEEVMMMMKDDAIATERLRKELGDAFFVVVAEGRNGVNKVYGRINGLRLTTGPSGTGQDGGDMNGSTINLAGEEDDIPHQISDALVAEILTAVS